MRLRPSKKTSQIIGYIVAVFAKKLGIRIHAICVLSDHWHVVVHDPFGNSVDFRRDCHSFIARVLNDAYEDTESLWSSDPTGPVRPLTPADTLDRIAYTMGNPVKHGLVKYGRSWPGIRRCWPDRPLRFKRPKNFFSAIGIDGDDGVWPEEAFLEMARPLGYEDTSDADLVILVRNAIAAAEAKFRADRAEAGKHQYLGRRKVAAQGRYSKAKTPEKKRRRRRSTVVCADPFLEKKAIEAEREWRAAYAECLIRWRRGERDVVFPHGTYKMRVLHNVNVADPPP